MDTMETTLAVIASVLVALWGVAHVVPIARVLAGFEPMTAAPGGAEAAGLSSEGAQDGGVTLAATTAERHGGRGGATAAQLE